MRKVLLAMSLATLVIVTQANAAKQQIYWERDVYLQVEKLTQQQKELIYDKYMSVGDDGRKGFLNKDIQKIKEIVTTFDKANKFEKELKEY